ncbi:MAG: HU family DNA-binding protein [Planctomycetota bacterium]|nr:HU family DNA-binding protein [Planctomycetota bacterium]
MAKKAPAKTTKKARIEGAKDKPRSKGDTLSTIAAATELSRKQVASVFETMAQIMAADLKTVKVFQVPGLMKVVRVDKPATKARVGPNPFNPGEMITFKAKPARRTVKIRALKGLKALV